MTPEQGYAQAKKQTPGYKVIMGPEAARAVRIGPLGDLNHLPEFPANWHEVDYGMRLSSLSMFFIEAAKHQGHKATKQEAAWLNAKSTSLADAQDWIDRIVATKAATEGEKQ